MCTELVKVLCSSLVLLGFAAQVDAARDAGRTERPSFLLIVADDLGYSDLGSFGGGDIETPTLDRMARAGMRFTRFYATPVCSPSRAALLTGMDPHKAGLGNMAEDIASNQRGHDSYTGYLNRNVVSVAELLRHSGYATLMTGKWHLGAEEEQGPAARGFDHSFALLPGGGDHFDMTGIDVAAPVAKYRDEGRLISELPRDFYSSDFYATRLIEYLAQVPNDTPFFAYLSFTAPHWPLQAPAALIDKYADRYDAGPAALRTARLAGLVREGMLREGAVPHDFEPPAAGWTSLPAQRRAVESRTMAVYAAMVERLDWNVGRVLAALERQGRLDNTFVVFLSDNGAEGHNLDDFREFTEFLAKNPPDNRLENIGHRGSFVWYGPHWAQAATAPGRLHKGYPSEGGVRVPAFVWGPAGTVQSGIRDGMASIMDLAPTLLDLAKVPPLDGSFRGRRVHRMEGRSLVPMLAGRTESVRNETDFLGWEVFGRSAILEDSWKLERLARPVDGGEWELFHLLDDPGQRKNLAESHPDVLRRLLERWESYSRDNHVILPATVTGY